METKTQSLPRGPLSPQKLQLFFVNHLNRIYCAKSHLQERLPEMRTYAHFTDLAHAITETLLDVEKQISRMNGIFRLLKVRPNFANCEGMIGLIEDTFTAIHQERKDAEMRDLSILFYLQNIESVEVASFRMLTLAAPVIGNKEIIQLLKESFDVARDDLTLLRFITANYLKNRDVRHQQVKY